MWTVDDMPDQTGRRVVVTGANSGLGREVATRLAVGGATVVMACRDVAKGEEAKRDALAEHEAADLRVRELDLADLGSIRHFVDEYRADFAGLDVLVNNAAVMMPPEREETADGFELHMGVNHLGHFALTGLLFGSLTAAGRSRVVTVSSNAHHRAELDPTDLQSEQRYRKSVAYANSKLANLLFTYELQRRLDDADASVIAVAAHPGRTATDLHRHTSAVRGLTSVVAQPVDMGALPILVAATSRGVRGADFFGPGGRTEMRGFPKRTESDAASHDEDLAAAVWEASEDLTGVHYPL